MKVFYVPHTHFDAEVFLTREEYLQWGFSILLDVLKLLDAEPSFKFTLDQVCYIEPFLQRYPEYRKTFQKFVDEKRLYICCGMYSMADMNMPSGEALARQFLRGVNYCRDELGVGIDLGWTIDSFGHPPTTPMIMRRAGIKWLAISRGTNFDVTDFIWAAPDGSEVLCHHMILSYVGIGLGSSQEEFDMLMENRVGKLAKYAATDSILLCEGADLASPDFAAIGRINKFNENHPDTQIVVATPDMYFEELEKNRDKLIRTEADLNPIFQGTYSSRIELKHSNRRLENMLTLAENVSAAAGVNIKGKLDLAWDNVLFNQFHDDICGCIMDRVFDVVMDRYVYGEAQAGDIIEKALRELSARVDTSGDGTPILAFNPLAWERRGVVNARVGVTQNRARDLIVRDSAGNTVPFAWSEVKYYPDGDLREALVSFTAVLPSMGYEVFHAIPVNERIPRFTIEEPEYQFRELRTVAMENKFFRAEVDSYTGVIKKLTLLSTGENIIDPDKPWGAMLVKEPDTGDFWELYSPLRGGMNSLFNRSLPPEGIPGAVYSKDAGGSCSNEIFKYGGEAVKQTFSIWRQDFGKSSFKLTMTMYDDIPRIDFNGSIDNTEPDVRYRAVFPTAAKGGRILRGVPFGFAETPEGEYPAVDFIDYGDGGTGVSLLNAGNPGNMVFGGTLAISLLKAASYKFYAGGGYDRSGSSSGGYEIGKSIPFAFSLCPHEGPCDPAKAARLGREFNMPVSAVKCDSHGGALPARHSFFSVGCDNAVTTCFKPTPARGCSYSASGGCDVVQGGGFSDSGRCSGGGGYVLRLYEAGGVSYENVTVSLDFQPCGVVAADITEKPLDVNDAVLSGCGFSFPLKANEVRTFLIYK